MNELSIRDCESTELQLPLCGTYGKFTDARTDGTQFYTIKYAVIFTHCIVLLVNTFCSFSYNNGVGLFREQVLHLWSLAHWPYVAGYDRVFTALRREDANFSAQDVGTEVSGRRSESQS